MGSSSGFFSVCIHTPFGPHRPDFKKALPAHGAMFSMLGTDPEWFWADLVPRV
jgi:hypothetical protein